MNFWNSKRKRKTKNRRTVLGRLWPKAAASRPAWPMAMRQWPIWPSRPARPACACVVTTTAGGTMARVPLVDRWPRVTTTSAQAPGGLRESVGQCFKDGDSPGRCGGGGMKRWHLSAAEALRWSPVEEKRSVRLATH
jgi:hypothetical protein